MEDMKKAIFGMISGILLISFIGLSVIGQDNDTAVCDSDNLDLCLDETTCTDATGFWYNDVCNAEEEVVCDSDNLNLCTGQSECENATGFWYNDVCNENEEVVEVCEDIENQDDCEVNNNCKWKNGECKEKDDDADDDGEGNGNQRLG